MLATVCCSRQRQCVAVDSIYFSWICKGLEFLKVRPQVKASLKHLYNDPAYVFGLLLLWTLHTFKSHLTSFGDVPFKLPLH